jgi:para-aminobenzoate synthetase
MTTERAPSILYIDAYDSFAENIAALLRQRLAVEVTFVAIDCDVPTRFGRSHRDFFAGFDAIVLGPGPGDPRNEVDVGLFNQAWKYAAEDGIPVLGICLGFQSLCAQHGVPALRMGLPCHGHAKEVLHVDRDIFADVPSVVATNYNSLGVRLKDFTPKIFDASRRSSVGSVDSLSSAQSLVSTSSTLSKPPAHAPRHRLVENLEVLAWDKDDWVMAVKHRSHPFYGFQFHPESCKSNAACHGLVERWWEVAVAHNTMHRTVARARLQDVGQSSVPPKANEDFEALEASLARLGDECSGGLTRMSVQLSDGRDRIASLCYELSPSETVVMLESTKRGRYSIYAFPDDFNFQLEYTPGRCTLLRRRSCVGTFHVEREHVTNALETFMCSKLVGDDVGSIPFRGGFAGFLSYEFGAGALNLDVPPRESRRAPSSTPDVSLLWVDRSVVFDNATGLAHVQSIRDNDSCWVEGMVRKIRTHEKDDLEADAQLPEILSRVKVALPDHDRYISQIRSCRAELLAGNSYELCLTTEAKVTTPAGPDNAWHLYRNIQRHNPVPFASYVRLNKTTILSSSPEQFLSWSTLDTGDDTIGTIDMIPMKGTVKKTPDMTLAKATAILACAKESAENLMIADLIRHDLYNTVGRDASVEVVKLCDVVETETVFSLVSHIRAHVASAPPTVKDPPEKDVSHVRQMTAHGIKALTRTLPPGSMTGAPKKRSCEILHRLERRDRGVYSGAIGYMDVAGNGAWSVCIRTAFSNDDDGEDEQVWRLGAGGAITVLSDEEQEWEEMMTKLDSVLRGFRPVD